MTDPVFKTCPRCDQPLTDAEKVCPSCRKPLIKTEGLAGVAAKAPNCPICKIPVYPERMEALKLGKTELDQCEKCGAIWLEGPKMGMLQDIIGPYKFRASKAR